MRKAINAIARRHIRTTVGVPSELGQHDVLNMASVRNRDQGRPAGWHNVRQAERVSARAWGVEPSKRAA
jgi:hypothetical protein